MSINSNSSRYINDCWHYLSRQGEFKKEWYFNLFTMKQFTESDMIEFAEWVGDNYTKYEFEKNHWWANGANKTFTTSELLEIFINKDNKPNEK